MTNDIATSYREIAPGIYWVGSFEQVNHLHCNSYLIVDGDEGVLIDPGSPLDFSHVFQNVTELISLSHIKYIVLQHQDPDLCASTPLFEERGFAGEIATHWRAAHLIKYYGVTSPFYIINEHRMQLVFGNNRTLQFYLTPYLHFSGAITTYDPSSRILFSSDLFGAFSRDWKLFADEMEQSTTQSYLEVMKAFHEHYMSSNDILRPVMEKFLHLDIAQIAPQHGSIIRHNIPQYIKALRDLECGSLLAPIKNDLSRIGGYTGLVNTVLKRYFSFYPPQEVSTVLENCHIELSKETSLIADYNTTGRELWQEFFQRIYSGKGISWLIFIEPLVSKLCSEYDIEMPQIFKSALLSIEETNLQLTQENQMLKNRNAQLEENILKAGDALLKCPVTQLNNDKVFHQYLEDECRRYLAGQAGGSLILVGLDGIAQINARYGNEGGDEVLKTIAGFLEEMLETHYALFRVEGPVFAIYLTETSKGAAADYGEKIRYHIQQEERFVEPLTVSIAITAISDFFEQGITDSLRLAEAVYRVARKRLQSAQQKGGNILSLSDIFEGLPPIGKVLIVDSDMFHSRVLKQALEDANITVLSAADGESALTMTQQERPEIIISEILLPKLDGFLLREQLRKDSDTDRIPFILLSILKDLESIKRAQGLEIEHYFQKPVLLTEITGIIILKLRLLSNESKHVVMLKH